jgi:hypothetical protein
MNVSQCQEGFAQQCLTHISLPSDTLVEHEALVESPLHKLAVVQPASLPPSHPVTPSHSNLTLWLLQSHSTSLHLTHLLNTWPWSNTSFTNWPRYSQMPLHTPSHSPLTSCLSLTSHFTTTPHSLYSLVEHTVLIKGLLHKLALVQPDAPSHPLTPLKQLPLPISLSYHASSRLSHFHSHSLVEHAALVERLLHKLALVQPDAPEAQ